MAHTRLNKVNGLINQFSKSMNCQETPSLTAILKQLGENLALLDYCLSKQAHLERLDRSVLDQIRLIYQQFSDAVYRLPLSLTSAETNATPPRLTNLTNLEQQLQSLQRQLQRQQQQRRAEQQIRQSLDLRQTCATAAITIGELYQAERVCLLSYDQRDHTWRQMVQYCQTEKIAQQATIQISLRDFSEFQLLIGGTPVQIDSNSALSWQQRWQQQYPGKWLLLPLMLPARPAEPGSLHWGVLALANSANPASWTETSLAAAGSIAHELSMAIQQSRLYYKLQLANQELRALALSDGLTQLANRRRFDEHLQGEWQRLTRERKPLSLIICDLDHFKLYNDHYGHPAGDRCLTQVAQALMQVPQRPADLVARYGGEEFAIVLPNTHTQGAWNIAQKIRDSIRGLHIPNPLSPLSDYVTVTIGIASAVPSRDSSPQSLLQAADLALYHAKQHGRDRAYVHAHFHV